MKTWLKPDHFLQIQKKLGIGISHEIIDFDVSILELQIITLWFTCTFLGAWEVQVLIRTRIVINSETFCRWCIILCDYGFMDFIHRPKSKILKIKITTFRKLGLLPASGEWSPVMEASSA
jgi:hypothetical protein